MPQLVPGSKNYLIERKIKGLGRYRVSSGTSDKNELKRRTTIVIKLTQDYGSEGLQALRLLKDKLITWRDLLDADSQGRLREVSKQILLYHPLHSAFEAWVSIHTSYRRGTPLGEGTKSRYRYSWQHFARRAVELKLLPEEGATVGDLLRLDWAKLRANWGAGGYDWNNFYEVLSAFLNSAFNRELDKYRDEVFKKIPSKEHMPDRLDMPIDAIGFLNVLGYAPEILRPTYFIIALTAAGPKPLRAMKPEHFDHVKHIIYVPDGKNEYRPRRIEVSEVWWPFVARAVIPCPVSTDRLRNHWYKAVKAAGITERVRLYDIRHLSAQLATLGGAPIQQIAMHMGQRTLQQTMRYLRGMAVTMPGQAITDVLLKATTPAMRAMLLLPAAATESSAGPASSDQADAEKSE